MSEPSVCRHHPKPPGALCPAQTPHPPSASLQQGDRHPVSPLLAGGSWQHHQPPASPPQDAASRNPHAGGAGSPHRVHTHSVPHGFNFCHARSPCTLNTHPTLTCPVHTDHLPHALCTLPTRYTPHAPYTLAHPLHAHPKPRAHSPRCPLTLCALLTLSPHTPHCAHPLPTHTAHPPCRAHSFREDSPPHRALTLSLHTPPVPCASPPRVAHPPCRTHSPLLTKATRNPPPHTPPLSLRTHLHFLHTHSCTLPPQPIPSP